MRYFQSPLSSFFHKLNSFDEIDIAKIYVYVKFLAKWQLSSAVRYLKSSGKNKDMKKGGRCTFPFNFIMEGSKISSAWVNDIWNPCNLSIKSRSCRNACPIRYEIGNQYDSY